MIRDEHLIIRPRPEPTRIPSDGRVSVEGAAERWAWRVLAALFLIDVAIIVGVLGSIVVSVIAGGGIP